MSRKAYSIAQWRQDYMANGPSDPLRVAMNPHAGLTLGFLAVFAWLAVMLTEYVLLGDHGLHGADNIFFSGAQALTAVPLINVAVLLGLMFRSDHTLPIMLSLLLAVPWLGFVLMRLGSLRAALAPAEIVVGP